MEKNLGNRQQKHIELYNAIDGLRDIIDRLNDLKDKVQGTPSNTSKDSKPEPLPSICGLLTNGPGIVCSMKDKILAQISELDDLLF